MRMTVLTVGMGTASIDRKGKEIEAFYGEKSEFTAPIAQTQYVTVTGSKLLRL